MKKSKIFMYITFWLIAIELTLRYIFKLGDIAAWISPFIWVSLAFQLYYGISAILKVKTKILNAEIATAQAEVDRIKMDFQRQQQSIVLERRLNPAGNISYFVDGVPIEVELIEKRSCHEYWVNIRRTDDKYGYSPELFYGSSFRVLDRFRFKFALKYFNKLVKEHNLTVKVVVRI